MSVTLFTLLFFRIEYNKLHNVVIETTKAFNTDKDFEDVRILCAMIVHIPILNLTLYNILVKIITKMSI